MPHFRQRHIIAMAVICGGLFWIFDVVIDAVIFSEGSVLQQIMDPSPRELWLRGTFEFFLAIFTGFICLIVRQRYLLEHDLQHALAEVATERAKSESIVAAIGDGISIQDTNLKILYQNQVHQELCGGDFVGSFCFAVYDQRDTACPECPVLAAFRDGGIHKLVKALPAGAPVSHVEMTASPLRDAAGNVVAGIELVRDISAYVQTQAELARKASDLEAVNRELEAFSSSVSHDLRKPLTIIYTAAQALKDECNDSPELSSYYIKTIHEASQRMEELIEALQGLARISSCSMVSTNVDLSAIALEISLEFNMIWPDRAVDWKIAEGLSCYGDPRLMRVLLENLLGNAWKYTKERPQAVIAFGRADTAQGEAFFVRDNGAGFDMSRVEELFKPFARLHDARNFPGTGIGLATVGRIIERHGGTVWAEGAVNAGAVFYFILPLAAGDGAAPIPHHE